MEEIQINTVFQNRVFMRFFLQKLKNKLHKKKSGTYNEIEKGTHYVQ